jgi:hypothetical protein
VDVNTNKMMPKLRFVMVDVDKLVTSFNGGWQMCKFALGKILLVVENSHSIFLFHILF